MADAQDSEKGGTTSLRRGAVTSQRGEMSHTYQNLANSGKTVGQASADCAEKVPLVHCIRGKTAAEAVRKFFESGEFQEVVSSKSTVRACNELGIPDGSMYFYAGRAFPENGVLVSLLFGGAFEKDGQSIETIIENENRDPACRGARPFDSGGLVTSDPEKKLCFIVEQFAADAKAYFVAHNETNILAWREYFALFLQQYFTKPSDYWKCPSVMIDGILFSSSLDWRNWTFEIHSAVHVSSEYVGKVFAGNDYNRFAQNRIGFGGSPGVAPILKSVLEWVEDPRSSADDAAKCAAN